MVIRTKYRGPTDTRPSRIVATAPGFSRPRRVACEYSHALSPERNHARAAMLLASRYGFRHDVAWVGGWCGSGSFVWVQSAHTSTAFYPTAAPAEVPA